MKQSFDTIQTTLKKHLSTLRDEFGVSGIGVFGSVARGDDSKKSDIDLLVEFDPSKKTFRNFIGISNYLEKLTGRPVDIVTPQSLSPYLKPHILKEVRYVETDR